MFWWSVLNLVSKFDCLLFRALGRPQQAFVWSLCIHMYSEGFKSTQGCSALLLPALMMFQDRISKP